MVYLIDMRIKYRPEDGAMWLQDDESSLIVLTVIMNRLLSYLLEHRGQVVTRDGLLENVWDLHGLRSSGHTLNKYISELRKQFRNFGVTTECITTIPRIGFMFEGGIDVQVLSQKPLNSQPDTNIDTSIDIAAPEKNDDSPPSRHVLIYPLIIAGIIAICSYFLPVEFLHQENVQVPKKDIPTYLLFNYGDCPVYTTQNNSTALAEHKKLLFLDLVNHEGIACLNGTSFLYQVSESYLYGREGRAFISRCTLKDNKYISCLNYYWSGYARKP